MSMSIGSTAAIAGTQGTSNGNAVGQQRRQAFQQLAQALQSGDLNAAQSAYGTLSSLRGGGRRNDGDADDQGSSTAGGSSGTTATSGQGNSNSPFAQLGQALQSGNLQAAQQAFQAMGSHHGHHHGQGSQQATASQQPASPQTPTSDSDTLGTNVNITV